MKPIPGFFAGLNIGGSGTDPGNLYVNRVEFNPGGLGHPEFVDNRALPATQLGAPGIYLGLPHGTVGLNGLFQAIPPEKIQATHPLLVDKFLPAWSVVTVPIIYYVGGVFNSAYIHNPSTDRLRLRAARECYHLCLEGNMW